MEARYQPPSQFDRDNRCRYCGRTASLHTETTCPNRAYGDLYGSDNPMVAWLREQAPALLTLPVSRFWDPPPGMPA